MCCIKFNANIKSLIILFVFQVGLAQRRLKNGEPLNVDKRYMVYLIRASASPTKYDAWLCGGALVTARSIVTAAACLEDVKYMYAIAGYKKYVTLEHLDNNKCTKAAKKKVVITCVPKRYDFAYEKIERWSFIDIGIAKVESNYEFTKVEACSYAPARVRVNFEEKWQFPGLDAFVLGWGHSDKWREEEDSNDYNQHTLHFTTTVIIPKEECKREYSNTPVLFDIIDRYMICADGAGNINPQGEIIHELPRVAEGCDPSRRHRNPESCEDEKGRPIRPKNQYPPKSYAQPNPAGYGQPYGQPDPSSYGQQYGAPNPYNQQYGAPNPFGLPYARMSENYMPPNPVVYNQPYKLRRDGGNSTREMNVDLHSSNDVFHRHATFWRNNRNETHGIRSPSRRNGICQNDHGGPLVTWVGAKEYLIGVASVFRIDENRDCTGPYLYTSTQCNAAFLQCVLSEDADWGEKIEDSIKTTATTTTTAATTTQKKLFYRGYTRKEFCELPPEQRGFDMVRRQISWVNHPDGPAENELTQHDLENLEIRPQIPINAFSGR